jgi:hypothetical protein
MKIDVSMVSRGRMIPCKGLMRVIPLSLSTKFVGMEIDEVVGSRNGISSQTLINLFTPLQELDSGYPTCNEWLMTDDDLLTPQQLGPRKISGSIVSKIVNSG